MSEAFLDIYNRLTKDDKERVYRLSVILNSRHKKRKELRKLSPEEEEIFDYFTGSLPADFNPEKALRDELRRKYGLGNKSFD